MEQALFASNKVKEKSPGKGLDHPDPPLNFGILVLQLTFYGITIRQELFQPVRLFLLLLKSQGFITKLAQFGPPGLVGSQSLSGFQRPSSIPAVPGTEMAWDVQARAVRALWRG